MFDYFPKLCLASGSIYRKRLLESLCIPFFVINSDVDETPRPEEGADHIVQLTQRLARAKAQAVIPKLPPEHTLILSADQLGCCNQELLGKPGNFEQAYQQLSRINGQKVRFYTSLYLWDTRQETGLIETIETTVTMRTAAAQELQAYLELEKPYDCAGSLKADSLGILFIESIASSDPTALIGLPLITVLRLLRTLGYPVLNTILNIAEQKHDEFRVT